jgi:hypothetical protein
MKVPDFVREFLCLIFSSAHLDEQWKIFQKTLTRRFENLGPVAGLIMDAVHSSHYFLKFLIWNWAWPNLIHLRQHPPTEKFWMKLIWTIIFCYRAKIRFSGVSNRRNDSLKADGALILQFFLQNILWIAIFCLRIWIWMYRWSYDLFLLHYSCNTDLHVRNLTKNGPYASCEEKEDRFSIDAALSKDIQFGEWLRSYMNKECLRTTTHLKTRSRQWKIQGDSQTSSLCPRRWTEPSHADQCMLLKSGRNASNRGFHEAMHWIRVRH